MSDVGRVRHASGLARYVWEVLRRSSTGERQTGVCAEQKMGCRTCPTCPTSGER